MKMSYLILLVLVTAAVSAIGCSGDDPSTPGNESGVGDVAESSIAVAPTSSSSTSFLVEIAPAAAGAAVADGAVWRPVDRWWERQELPGTAQGCWFQADDSGKDIPRTDRPADPHLALVGIEDHQGAPVIACGPGFAKLAPGAYAFDAMDAGFFNRPFAAVIPDGNVYAVYLDLWVDRTILLHMPDDNTLWVEAFAGPPGEPAQWTFTSGKAVFVR